jgi:hypothetical protein
MKYYGHIMFMLGAFFGIIETTLHYIGIRGLYYWIVFPSIFLSITIIIIISNNTPEV